MRIAIDVMGGDHAPDAILAGAFDGLELLNDDDQMILVGDFRTIEKAMVKRGLRGEKRLIIEGTTQVIGMGEKPTKALRDKSDSSIARLAWLGSKRCPKEKRAAVILSAGNTGACVAAAQMLMRRLACVHRPGIAVTLPTFAGQVVLCDVGANIVPKPHHLHQYGHMAAIYANTVHGIRQPRVGVLSIGSEESKGTSLVQEAHRLLKVDSGVLNYIGFVEGRDLFSGVADVIVTEGFVGNVVLKLAEGLAGGLMRKMAQFVFEENPELAVKFEPVVSKLKERHDYHEFGGAMLLGTNGMCMIAHGSSEPRTIRAAIRSSLAISKHDMNGRIVETLGALSSSRGNNEK